METYNEVKHDIDEYSNYIIIGIIICLIATLFSILARIYNCLCCIPNCIISCRKCCCKTRGYSQLE